MRDYVLYEGRLVVSAKEDVRTRFIEDLCARILTAHPCRNKTRQLLCENYWWLNMNGDINVYVERMAKQAIKNRRELDFGVGDMVFMVKISWPPIDRPSDN